MNQEESEASLRETEQHVRVLEREMETVRVERERVQRELAAASGNKEETERILTEEVCTVRVCVYMLITINV